MSRVPFYDEVAEAAVVGAVVTHPHVVDLVVATDLRPEHFYNNAYRNLWTAVLELYNDERPIDAVTVQAAAGTFKGLIAECVVAAANMATSDHAPGWANAIRNYARCRWLLEPVDRLSEALLAGRWDDAERIVGEVVAHVDA